jgi:hypothetical protein
MVIGVVWPATQILVELPVAARAHAALRHII